MGILRGSPHSGKAQLRHIFELIQSENPLNNENVTSEMIDYFYEVDERYAMFFYSATPLDEAKCSQGPLRALDLSGVERGHSPGAKHFIVTVKRFRNLLPASNAFDVFTPNQDGM